MCQVSDQFKEYMRAYTRLSVRMLGRWPAFVAQEDRNKEQLDDLGIYVLDPDTPAHLQYLPEEQQRRAPLPQPCRGRQSLGERVERAEGVARAGVEVAVEPQQGDALETRRRPVRRRREWRESGGSAPSTGCWR